MAICVLHVVICANSRRCDCTLAPTWFHMSCCSVSDAVLRVTRQLGCARSTPPALTVHTDVNAVPYAPLPCLLIISCR
jgi:hypothetical protein